MIRAYTTIVCCPLAVSPRLSQAGPAAVCLVTLSVTQQHVDRQAVGLLEEGEDGRPKLINSQPVSKRGEYSSSYYNTRTVGSVVLQHIVHATVWRTRPRLPFAEVRAGYGSSRCHIFPAGCVLLTSAKNEFVAPLGGAGSRHQRSKTEPPSLHVTCRCRSNTSVYTP